MDHHVIAMHDHTFNHVFHQLFDQEKTLAWARSIDYQKQLYLSHQFENIFDAPTTTLYDSPNTWINFVCKEDLNRMNRTISNRLNHLGNQSWKHIEEVTYYRILTPKGKVRYIKGWTIPLLNQQNQIKAIAGISQQVASATWHKEQTNQTKDYPFLVLPNEVSLSETLLNEKKLIIPETKQSTPKGQEPPKHFTINDQLIELTPHQYRCIEKLCQGYSAKQTAHLLHISTRTVENHLATIKKKARCRSKLQLVIHILKQINIHQA